MFWFFFCLFHLSPRSRWCKQSLLVMEPVMPIASGVLHSPKARVGTGVFPQPLGSDILHFELAFKKVDEWGSILVRDRGWQQLTLLTGTSVAAFHPTSEALPAEHSPHHPSRGAVAAEEITVGVRRLLDVYFAPVFIFQKPSWMMQELLLERGWGQV